MSNDNHFEARQQSILAAAAEAFDAHGYAATTIDEVARQAGISKGSVYNYFHSKQELFTQLFAQSLAPTEADVDRMLEDLSDPAGMIERLIDYWYGELDYHKRTGRLMLEFRVSAAREEQDGDLTRLLREMHRRWIDRIGRILRRGIERGVFRADLDLERVAWGLIGQFDGLLMNMILDVGMEVDEAMIASLKQWILTALGFDRAERNAS